MNDLYRRIMSNCVEVGDCLEWQGKPSKANGGMYVSYHCEKISIRRFLWEREHGPVPFGKRITTACGNPRCVRCLQCLTFSQINKRIGKSGKFSTPAFRAKVSAARRMASKLSDEAVSEVLSFDGPVKEIAAAKGISESYAYMLRRGDFRRDFKNPFAALLPANDSQRRTA